MLEELFVAFARKVAALLDAEVAVRGVSPSQLQRTTFNRFGERTEHTEAVPTYRDALNVVEDSIQSEPISLDCARAHFEAGALVFRRLVDAAGVPIGEPSFAQVKYFAVRALLAPAFSAFSLRGSSAFTDSELLEAYRAYLPGWRLEHAPLRFFAPLIRMQAPMDPISVAGVELSYFTPEEKSQLWTEFMIDMVSRRAYSESFLKLTISTDGDPVSQQKGTTSLLRALTALRLLKPGAAGAIVFLSFPALPTTYGWISASTPREAEAEPRVLYELRDSDVPQLQRIAELIAKRQDERSLGPLEIALERFNFSYGRASAEDRIIDLAIALEATLLGGSASGEQSYRLALRGAALLAPDRPPRETSRFLKAMSEVRNGIVHGGLKVMEIDDAKLRGTGIATMAEIPDVVENLVRAVLLTYLERVGPSASVRTVNADLDDALLGALSWLSKDTVPGPSEAPAVSAGDVRAPPADPVAR
jgi:hypothetical protein